MKKSIKIFLCLILSIVAIFCFTACNDDNNEQNDSTVVLLTDFEDTYSLMSIKITAPQSQIYLNEDKNFVSSGEKSMKMHLNQALSASGYYADTILQFIPGQQYFAHTDFKDVTAITADIWNDNGFDIDMCLSVNNRRVVLEYGVLKPGYNKVVFNIDPTQAFALSETFLTSVDLSFYSGVGNEILYIDNVCVKTTDKAYSAFNFDKIFGDDDISYGFENYAEMLNMIDLGGFDSIFSRARLSINNDKNFVKNSDGSLKIEFKNSPDDNKVDNTVIRTYDNYFADFNKYVLLGNYALTADLYNATNKTITAELKVFSTIDDETCSVMVDIPANSWSNQKFSIPLDRIKHAFTNQRISVLTVVLGFYGVAGQDVVYLDNLGFSKYQPEVVAKTDLAVEVGQKVAIDKTLFDNLDVNKNYTLNLEVKSVKGLTSKTLSSTSEITVEASTYYEVSGIAVCGTETVDVYKIIYPNDMTIFTFNHLGNDVYTSDNSDFGMLDSTVKTQMKHDNTNNGKIGFGVLNSVDYELWAWISQLRVGKNGGKMYFDLTFEKECDEWLIELVKNEVILFDHDAGRYCIEFENEETGKNIVYKFGVNGPKLYDNLVYFDNIVFVQN